jgi:hypothetical protein
MSAFREGGLNVVRPGRPKAVCGALTQVPGTRRDRDDVSPSPCELDRSQDLFLVKPGQREQPRALDPAAAEYYG